MGKGDRIRQLREQKKLTQEELARLLDTKRQTISKYEKEIVTNIPSDRIEAMARILDTTPEYILGWPAKEENPANDARLSEKQQNLIDEEENPANDAGLSEKQQKLIDFAKTVPDDQIDMVLRVMRSIVESDE